MTTPQLPAVCRCEHVSHFEGRNHVYNDPTITAVRRAFHVGPVCWACASSCMAEYLHAEGCQLLHPEDTPCVVSARVSFAVVSGPLS